MSCYIPCGRNKSPVFAPQSEKLCSLIVPIFKKKKKRNDVIRGKEFKISFPFQHELFFTVCSLAYIPRQSEVNKASRRVYDSQHC